jgi:anthranilate synthase component 2
VSAQSEDDREIMGVRHRVFPIEGVQFHPESILTVHGHRIIENFLEH